MINWQTILASVLFSSTIVSAVLFIFKKMLEKGIETKFKEIENRQRLNLEEAKRRQGKIFDDQYDLSKTIVALTYRVRNKAREIMNELNNPDFNPQLIGKKIKAQSNYHKYLDKLLLDNRAILPDLLFNELHPLKNCINSFNSYFYFLANKERLEEERIIEIKNEMQELYTKIDEHYLVITGLVQSAIGLDK
jgi:hypothetical protein